MYGYYSTVQIGGAGIVWALVEKDPDDLPEPEGPQGPDVRNDPVPETEPDAEPAAGTDPEGD